ncbi:MAG: molecular chaperone TorD family protein [Aliarcobacter skirrowii]|uniref:TorD/DmsD family molecular chaperone n=1 Tax=Aliarcobacter skirrowii TaxID=28200 RepID=UPI00242C4DA5|nr:molecular chaperone TorD family protein [Aliarcobacter skirrowii]MDD2508873.1 molecular chaperone TorD family protein [Aliarcobacter skirrowii]MDD3497487.1 molecular chaperone TorD family protein [Aliarcobacter skirrowii]
MNNIDVDKARAFIYNLLSLLFVEEYAKTKEEEIKEALTILSQNSFSQIVENSSINILNYLNKNNKNILYEDYQSLFLVPFGEFVPLGISWYHEEREGGIMQLKVKDILAKTKIRRDESSFKAQEDHFGFVFTLSSYLIENQINKNIKENLQKELFDEVLGLYMDKLAYKLMATKSEIYSNVGLILESFFDFEKGYLGIK